MAVGVALVVLRTTAHRPAASHCAPCVGSARIVSAGISATLGPQRIQGRTGVGNHSIGSYDRSSGRRPSSPWWFTASSDGTAVDGIATWRSVPSIIASADCHTLRIYLAVCVWTTWCWLALTIDLGDEADGSDGGPLDKHLLQSQQLCMPIHDQPLARHTH